MMQYVALLWPWTADAAMWHDASVEHRNNPLTWLLSASLFCLFFFLGWWEVSNWALCTTNRWSHRWWQTAGTGNDKIITDVQQRIYRLYAPLLLTCYLFCLVGQFSEGVLRLLTDSTATKQRCVLQDPLQHGNSASVGSYTGESESVPSETKKSNRSVFLNH